MTPTTPFGHQTEICFMAKQISKIIFVFELTGFSTGEVNLFFQ
jgi:hypothetical protein